MCELEFKQSQMEIVYVWKMQRKKKNFNTVNQELLVRTDVSLLRVLGNQERKVREKGM
jgi:hypothetical protein